MAASSALTVDWPGSPVGAVRLDGPLAIDGPLGGTGSGPQLVVGPLLARLASGGWILVAGAHGPGRVDLALDRWPLPIAGIDLLVRGSRLTTRHAIGGISLRGLALALALRPRDPQAHTLRLTGSVNVGYTVFRLGGGSQGDNKPKSPPKSPAAHHPNALDRIWADNVQLVGPQDAVKAKVSYVPAVTVGLRCTLNGPLAAPLVAGQVKGAGVYSRFALMVASQ